MRLVVDSLESLRGDVRVNLRGLQAGVPEHLLHHAQVGTALEHVGRRCMAQRVWANVLHARAAPLVGSTWLVPLQ